jgi:hypothetical protein
VKERRFFTGLEQAAQVADIVLERSLEDPRLRELMEQMLHDEAITKRQLAHTAFAQGVISTLAAIDAGWLGVIPRAKN